MTTIENNRNLFTKKLMNTQMIFGFEEHRADLRIHSEKKQRCKIISY